MAAKSPLAVREVKRTERPGGSALVHLFPLARPAPGRAVALIPLLGAVSLASDGGRFALDRAEPLAAAFPARAPAS